ncbi:LysR family transcriptional regulator [Microlunatus soli]|uniref:DNA-binding transcriptional regulator, LysR family n=1 Tax=Microlunatus soli TaxID=630515 RepID=A0A1H1UEQ2_9ACTN|nr:LysR family transcriptional regulator [Microlunatus soli]SDS70676.1 DNA-binding transcriptional regulator, LysR family [Microlunatus soli]
MELRQLEYFVAVAESRTFTAAAARLNVVQSGVSTTIRALERDLGVRLFERSAGTGAPRLTAAGQALLTEARTLINSARATREVVQRADDQLGGEVDLGIMTALAPVDLPRLLADFGRAAPGVQVRLHVRPRGSTDLVRGVDAGEFDLAFVGPSEAAPPTVRLEPIATLPMPLLLPPTHRLARRSRVRLGDLDGERWVDSPPGFGTRIAVDAAFVHAGLTRTVVLEVPDVQMIPGMVAAGLGVGFAPGEVDPDLGVRTVRLPEREQPIWRLRLATRPGRRRPAVALLLDVLARQHSPTARHR